MKTKLIVCLLALAPIVSSAGILDKVIRPEGAVTIQERNVGHFNAVDISNGIALEIINDATTGVRIETQENIHPYIETFVSENKLVIRIRKGTSLSGKITLKAYVKAPTLREIDASGGSRITVGGSKFTSSTALEIEISGGGKLTGNVSARSFDIDLSGGSRIDGNLESEGTVEADISGGGSFRGSLTCGTFDVDLSGGSTIELSGKCGKIYIECSGGGRMLCAKLDAISVNGDMSGGSRGEFTTREDSRVTTSGGSKVTIYKITTAKK